MSDHEEQYIRALITDTTKWVNGDAYRNWMRKLLDEIDNLRKLNTGHCERIHAQSELLSKKAEK